MPASHNLPAASTPVFIYALIDPFTGERRYVGKSIRPRERLMNHCNEPATCRRTKWIQSVIRKGGRPLQEILEELPPGADWQAAERRWISIGRGRGWPLTNGTDGGDGVPGISGDAKDRMLATWKGRKHRPETLVKLSATSRGRRHTDGHKEYMREIMAGREITWGDKIAAKIKKLSDDQVREIRVLISEGSTLKSIGPRYGVHWSTIANIKNGRYYREVT